MKGFISGAICGGVVWTIASVCGFSVWAALACMFVGTINGIVITWDSSN